jgi:hypothetical protein
LLALLLGGFFRCERRLRKDDGAFSGLRHVAEDQQRRNGGTGQERDTQGPCGNDCHLSSFFWRSFT